MCAPLHVFQIYTCTWIAHLSIVSRFLTNSIEFKLEMAFLFQFIQKVSFYCNVRIQVQMYMHLGVAGQIVVLLIIYIYTILGP